MQQGVNSGADTTALLPYLADPAAGILPRALVAALDGPYRQAALTLTTAPRREQESEEYGACRLALAGRRVVFRVAKTTPTKIGQFVTIWKRPTPTAEIAPLDSTDEVDFVVVSVADAFHSGQFVFDQEALLKHGVMSRGGAGGKRAIRVYPPWSKPVAKDAIRTQLWQLRYFVALAPRGDTTPAQLRRLFQV
ncbi:MepB family protein [Oxalobacteraceae bacterium]|nr:MepB family protein [Oxalobacteraceae bacterium]